MRTPVDNVDDVDDVNEAVVVQQGADPLAADESVQSGGGPADVFADPIAGAGIDMMDEHLADEAGYGYGV